MPRHLLLGLATLAPACAQLGVTAEAGYTEMAIKGDVALAATSGGGTANLHQDLRSAFGLGDAVGSVYGRAQFDFGVPVLTIAGFEHQESGRGTLSAPFGTLPPGTNVVTDLDFATIKASLAFDIGVGPVTLAPGVAVDYVDLDMQVQDTFGLITEDIHVTAPIPLLFLRAEAAFGDFGLLAELGYLDVPQIHDVQGTFFDAELLAEARLTPAVHLFAGYRFLSMDAHGTVDNQDFATDLDVEGWVVGGGLRF